MLNHEIVNYYLFDKDIFIANIKNDRESNNIINLSNNTGISECPSIAISKNYIYIVW